MGECVPDYGHYLFVKGFKGIQEEAEEKLKNLDRYDGESYSKQKFYEAVIIACKAAKVQSDRYAARALELASLEKDPQRKKELEDIASMCMRVPTSLREPLPKPYSLCGCQWFFCGQRKTEQPYA